MNGEWIHREADAHKCDKPRYGESAEKPAAVGDQWQCGECGRIWEIVRVIGGDQRDPMPMNYITEWKFDRHNRG